MAEVRFPIRFDLAGEWAITEGAEWVWPIRLQVSALPAPPFTQSTVYTIGDYLVPQAGAETGSTYIVVTSGTAAAANPVWPTVPGGRVTSGTTAFMAIGSTRLLDTDTYNAEFRVRADYDDPAVIVATIALGRIERGYDPPKWAATTVYGLGQQVVPTGPNLLNGWVYQVTVAGTSGGAEPVWPTTLGAVVTNGTVTFRNVSTDAGVTNLRVVLPSSYTDGIANWGLGLYDLELYDPFSKITRIFEGVAELSRDIT